MFGLLSRPLGSSHTEKTLANGNSIGSVVFDSNRSSTTLCKIGARYHTDKSPLNPGTAPGSIAYCHAYTPIYDSLFAPLRYKPITLAEVGIYHASGLQMFREYFTEAELYGFEFEERHIRAAVERNIPDTQIYPIDVTDEQSIISAFSSTGKLFDIIIDDSTHDVDDQSRLIRLLTDFVKPGGYLIIEDIYRDSRAPEEILLQAIEEVSSKLCKATFFYPKNRRTKVGSWNNEKLLVMVKNNC